MDIVQRAQKICLTPATEWPVIAAEPTSTGELITGYAVPLAAIGAVAGFIGTSIVGSSLPFVGYYRQPIFSGLIAAVVGLCLGIVAIFIASLIINALAPTFGAEKNSLQALKLVVYASTPAWIAGVLRIIPLLGILAIVAGLYSIYVFYLGLPRLMKNPEDKTIAYAVVSAVCIIVVSWVVFAVAGMIGFAGIMGSGALSPRSASSSSVQFDKDSPMGKLQEFGKQMEASNKKVEAATKAGDQNAAAAAAMASLGTLMGGGKRVDPVSIDQLKPLIPDTLGGMPKTSSNADKSGIAGLMVSKAEATYSDGAGKSVNLEITDTGGVSGLMGLAGWAGIEGEHEDDSSTERTQKSGGRLTHEKISKNGGTNEFDIVLGDRFVVGAKGHGVDLPSLKAAIGSLDLAKLESMKDAGVAK
ncbi:MAG TPA: Yip1 family protein [Vicinamibacterales bacterium]